MVFFFQAEDGIRDHCVTGVQTCALPISIPETFVGVFAFLRLSAGPVLPGPLTSHRPPLHRPGGVVAAGMAGNAIHRRGRQRRRGQRRGEPGRKERRVELRADLHLHTRERESFITYDARELIDGAEHAGFQVLSITNHDTVTFSADLEAYARERGILLIPGVEATIEGKHVLLYRSEERRVGKE